MKSLMIIIILLVPFSSCKKQENLGSATFLLGTVTLNNKPVKLNQIIKPGSVITTGKDSICEIIFYNKNIIRINPESSVVLNIDKTVNNIDIKIGTVLSVMKKLTKNGFTIKTPTTTASIRGTTFYIKVENPDNTYLCNCNGIIKVDTKDKKTKKELSAMHHKAVQITNKNNDILINDAEMKYHTDADMEKLAKKIGVIIDWKTIDGE